MSADPSETGYRFPYEDEITGIMEELREYQTRVRPENTNEIREFDLDYGWKAILYERDEKRLTEKLLENLTQLTAYNIDYVRKKPQYEWELETPNGETFHRLGLDIEPEKFGEKINDFLQRN